MVGDGAFQVKCDQNRAKCNQICRYGLDTDRSRSYPQNSIYCAQEVVIMLTILYYLTKSDM